MKVVKDSGVSTHTCLFLVDVDGNNEFGFPFSWIERVCLNKASMTLRSGSLQ